MAGTPEDVFTARLDGGPMNDAVVEIDAGIETMRMGGPPLVVFGAGAPSEASSDQVWPYWEYRFVSIENVADPDAGSEAPRRAVFEFIGPSPG